MAMIALGILLHVAQPSTAMSTSRIAVRLEAALQGIPNQGHLFRATVERVLSQAPTLRDDFSGPLEVEFSHPIGSPILTVITLDHSGVIFLADSIRGKARVSVLAKESYSDAWFTLEHAARFGKKLILYGRQDGGASARPIAFLFARIRGRWREKQVLTALSEEAWQGNGEVKRPEFVIDKSRLGTIHFDMALRDSPRLFAQCHMCPGLRYEEHWAYAGGRLRRLSRHRVLTPLAEVSDLASLVERGHRTEFNARVPKNLQREVWRWLAGFIGSDEGLDPVGDGPDSDELSDLCPRLAGHGWTVTLAKHEGGWRVTLLEETRNT